jgi:hypothetical protein
VPNIDNNFIYLGHPLIIPRKDRTIAYNFVFDKLKSKLSAYKADKFSHAARLELIKSVFSSIPVYYMPNIIFTNKFITKHTVIIRNFWWTGVKEEIQKLYVLELGKTSVHQKVKEDWATATSKP